ncbi:hypothetical protein [Corallococcus coralloides]|nr:hypothetical protein [Corallococcus coralloides]
MSVRVHLRDEEQAQSMAHIARALKPGAAFLFTSGDAHGSIHGEPMNGMPFLDSSYRVDGDGDLLRAHGFTLEATHADSCEAVCFLSRKTGCGGFSPSAIPWTEAFLGAQST